ncbi:MAG: ABC transporter ATP-binding protein/permease [Acidobacteria bacterium]|nr:ABC transporter ATP-binding protein/permease [Acidobacteriota bacterium]
MLAIRNLQKTFGSLVAVDDVSFAVEPGMLLGLLGPNGAGKTTTVSMIAGLVKPDRGEVLIGGAPLAGDTDPKKRKIGLVPQDLALYDELSAKANLQFFGSLYRLSGAGLESAISSSMTLVGLADRQRDLVRTFSGGLLVAALGRTPAATRGVTTLAVLMMVMLGGAWVPTFVFPRWLQRLTVVVPARWAVDGLDAMTWRGIGPGGAVVPTLVLLAFAALFGSIALARFRWDEAGG